MVSCTVYGRVELTGKDFEGQLEEILEDDTGWSQAHCGQSRGQSCDLYCPLTAWRQAALFAAWAAGSARW